MSAAAAGGSTPPPQYPPKWTAGKSVYTTVQEDGKHYAVLDGCTLQDAAFVFIIRWHPDSKQFFFANRLTKDRVWDLPELTAPPQVTAAAQTPPTSTTTGAAADIRRRVAAIYQAYCPDKMDKVDVLIAQYAGKEEQLIPTLIKKYGPEPTVPATASYYDRVKRIYEAHNPSKANDGNVMKQLEKFKGQEDSLIKMLVDKYGPEPPVAPSPQHQEQQGVAPQSSENAAGPVRRSAGAATPPPPSQPVSSSDSTAPNVPATQPPSGASSSNEAATPPSAESAKASNSALSPREASGPAAPQAQRQANSAQAATSSTSSVALAEAQNREQILVSFVQDRELRLHEAHQRYEAASQALDSLRKTNRDLVAEMDSLRRSVDQEVHSARLEMDRLREDTQLSKNEWHREKQRLQSAVDDAADNSSKILQIERLRLEEQALQFIGEKAQLQSDLHKAKQDLNEQMRCSSDLVVVLDKRDKDHQRLLRQIDDLQRKIEGVARATKETQTEDCDILEPLRASGGAGGRDREDNAAGKDPRSLSYSPELSPGNQQHHAKNPSTTLSAIEEFDRVMAADKFRRAELDTWRAKCKQLEKQLHSARDHTGGGGYTFPSPKSANESQHASQQLRALRATIGALRNANRALEQKVGELELRLVAQPSSELTALHASPHDEEDHDVLRLREAVRLLKDKLDASQIASRNQKREIQELRGQLMKHMSTSSPQSYRR